MDLKELRKEIEGLKESISIGNNIAVIRLEGIKQTVEAIEKSDFNPSDFWGEDYNEWQKIKELLNLK